MLNSTACVLPDDVNGVIDWGEECWRQETKIVSALDHY